MANVFSVLLGANNNIGTAYHFGPPPAGTIWVIRDVSFYFAPGLASTYGGESTLTDSNGIVICATPNPMVPFKLYHYDLRQVITSSPAVTLTAFNAASFSDFRCTGYQLTLP